MRGEGRGKSGVEEGEVSSGVQQASLPFSLTRHPLRRYPYEEVSVAVVVIVAGDVRYM